MHQWVDVIGARLGIVYLAEMTYNYDDGYVIGVFSTKEKAEEAIQKASEKILYNDGTRITEYTIDESSE